MKKDTYRLDDKNEFDLIVYYDPDSEKPWETVIVRKSVSGIIDEKYLEEKIAAMLKFILDNANEDNRFLSTNDLPSNRPQGYNLEYSVYRAIRGFLGDYSKRIKTKKSRNGGVYFDITNVICIRGETVSPPKVISVINEEESFSLVTEIPEGDCSVALRKLREVARELCKTARDSGRLIAPDKLPPTEKVKLPELHAEAELTRNEKIKTLRQLIDELSDEKNTSLRGVFVTGSGGSGKTFSLLDYTATSLDGTTDHASVRQPIPIYIALNQMNAQDNPYRSIESFIIDRLEGFTTDSNSRKIIEEQYFSWLNSTDSQYYPLLLLDGFNEVTDSNIQNHIGAL